MHLEFETRVKNGLPVIVEVEFEASYPADPGYCDILGFKFLSGHEFKYTPTETELNEIWSDADIITRGYNGDL